MNTIVDNRGDDILKRVPVKVDIVICRLDMECSEEDMFQFLADEGVDI